MENVKDQTKGLMRLIMLFIIILITFIFIGFYFFGENDGIDEGYDKGVKDVLSGAVDSLKIKK